MREYARVDVQIPLDIQPVEQEELSRIRSGIVVESVMTDIQSIPELDDERLSDCLKIINSKLNTIIGMLAFQNRTSASLQYHHVNISAGGLSAEISKPFNLDDIVEIRVIFPTMPYYVFHIYGKVVRSQQTAPGSFLVSFEFIEIDEDMRDKIAKFVFDKQREIIRKKRGQ